MINMILCNAALRVMVYLWTCTKFYFFKWTTGFVLVYLIFYGMILTQSMEDLIQMKEHL